MSRGVVLDPRIREYRRWDAKPLATPNQRLLDRLLAANVRLKGQDILRPQLCCVGR